MKALHELDLEGEKILMVRKRMKLLEARVTDLAPSKQLLA